MSTLKFMWKKKKKEEKEETNKNHQHAFIFETAPLTHHWGCSLIRQK